MFQKVTGVFTAAAMAWAAAAHAITPADKCEANKLKRAALYSACRLKAESKAIKKGEAPDYTKCDSKFAQKWASAETNAGGMCPTNGDLSSMQARIAGDTSAIAACLSGTCPPSGVLPATGETTSYGPGSDGDVQAGVARSYTDNGDGTITDNSTGLMWEKKSDDGSIHDWNNSYQWCADAGFDFACDTVSNSMDGAIKTAFLDMLNDVGGGGVSCFAGYCDWRIPNHNELLSIVDFGNATPSVSTVFNTGCVPACTVLTCSCTQPDFYWSSSTYHYNPELAWFAFFDIGLTGAFGKPSTFYVRAVRGGL